MNMMKTALDRKMRMTGKAFTKVRQATGQETYRPLEIYQKLKPEHFSALVERYGADNTLRFIQAMEARRLRGNNGSR